MPAPVVAALGGMLFDALLIAGPFLLARVYVFSLRKLRQAAQ